MGGFTSDDCAARLCYLAKALHLDLRIADMGVHEDDIANLAEAYMAKKRPKPSGKKPPWKPHLIRENSLMFDV